MNTSADPTLPELLAPAFLLFETDEELLARVYQLEEAPDLLPLFAETPLHAHQKQGPLLIGLPRHSALLGAYITEPEHWPGVLLTSPRPVSQLVGHLRNMLTVTFDGQRKALLRYYDPRIASYFFPLGITNDRELWLGPIQQIIWFGGTWADSANGSHGWHQQLNANYRGESLLPTAAHLSEQQISALEHLQLERFAFDWQQQANVAFPQAMGYLAQGLELGFDEADPLHAYLNLRARYPHHATHPAPPAGEPEQRLNWLSAYLQTSPDFTEPNT